MFRFEHELARILRSLSLEDVPEEAVSRMAALDRLLVQWSARMDLVGFKTPDERLARYFVEPLAAAAFLPGVPADGWDALDIGSGGGSPALPLAIRMAGSRWTLLEPRRKKALFLEEAARLLGLTGVRVVRERFHGGASGAHDVVTTRGVRLGTRELESLVGSLRSGGRFLWFSGEARQSEMGDRLAGRRDVRVRGPMRLLRGSSGSSLVVVEKLAQGECFT